MTNFERVEALAVSFQQTNDRKAYNSLAEELIPYTTQIAKNFTNQYPFLDTDLLISIGLCEIVNTTLASWKQEEIPFKNRYYRLLLLAFKNEIKNSNLNKNKANIETVDTTVEDDEGNQTSFLNMLPSKENVEEEVIFSDLLKNIKNSLTTEEVKLLEVLMENTGKARGQAVASFFNVDSYDQALRKKVSRFQQKIQALLSQM